mmetsp:Transcript_15676/g.51018  ORF Transcript_15676/g.51018 Transcript_15676/m.51018 type:complete len:279 (-) Transcript_15676:92-928(-)
MGERVVEEEVREAAGGRRERRRHRDLGRDGVAADDAERRPRVEAVPADPEEERAQDHQGHGVAVDGLRVRAEAAEARPEDRRADARGRAADHVDDAAAREVDDADLEPGRLALGHEGREEAVAAPDPVDDHGVDEAREDRAVARVRAHGAPLRDGAGDDRRRRRREGELEEPVVEAAVALVAVGEEEVLVPADEPVAAGRVGPVRERVARRPEPRRADARVHEVLEQDVLRILRADGPGAQHGEARLHQEDEDAAVEEPVNVGAGRDGVITDECGDLR